jgi:outer membrane protein assembly factor BamB
MKASIGFGAVFAATMATLFVGCDEYGYHQRERSLTVMVVSGTSHVAPGDTGYFVITSRAANCDPSFRYLMHWGDSTTSTANPHVAGDTYQMHHVWEEPGHYVVFADAKINAETSSILIHPSASWIVNVSSASDPLIDSVQFNYQWRPVELVVYASGTTGEDLRLAVQWGDSLSDTTGFQPGPCRLAARHRYADAGPVRVVFRVLRKSGAGSAPDTLEGEVSATGEVAWFRPGIYAGSPVVAGGITYIVGSDGLYGLSDTATPYFYPGLFSGQPSVSSQTLHGYVGSEDGRLHAFSQELTPVWEYPPRESVTGWKWGPAAVNGNELYIPCSNDSIYCLRDEGDSVVRVATFAAGSADAVVIDATGNVYFGSDSGYLYKLTAGLDFIWHSRVQSQGRIFGPVIGAGGTIYCSSDSRRLYAVNAGDGSIIWQQTLADVCELPVLGSDGVYAATASGLLYKLDLATGQTIWQTQLGVEGLLAAPVVATAGYVYVQAGGDRLYCLEKTTGDSVWVCNAVDYLPPGRRMHPSGDVSNPCIDAGGRVSFIGGGAFYVLNTQSELDFTAPWPKWQHDLYNTGFVGGGTRR